MSDERTAADLPLPGGSFRLFITRLSYQALMSLGLIENPITQTKALQIDNARMLIDDLAMLRDKTKGNLDAEEDLHLQKLVADLEAAFAKVSAGSEPG